MAADRRAVRGNVSSCKKEKTKSSSPRFPKTENEPTRGAKQIMARDGMECGIWRGGGIRAGVRACNCVAEFMCACACAIKSTERRRERRQGVGVGDEEGDGGR